MQVFMHIFKWILNAHGLTTYCQQQEQPYKQLKLWNYILDKLFVCNCNSLKWKGNMEILTFKIYVSTHNENKTSTGFLSHIRGQNL